MRLTFQPILLLIVSLIFPKSIENFSVSNKLSNKVHISFNNNDVVVSMKDGYSDILEDKNSTKVQQVTGIAFQGLTEKMIGEAKRPEEIDNTEENI